MIQDATRHFISPLESAADSSFVSYPPRTTVVSGRELSTSENITAIASVVRAISSPLRIRMLLALNERPHFVSELVTLVGGSQPLVSQHLKVLKTANLVNADRSGRQMSYSLSQPRVIDILALSLETAEDTSA